MTPDRAAVNVSGRRLARSPLTMLAALAVTAGACRGNAPSAAPPTEDEARIACDRYAAAAIQQGDPLTAANLSRQAMECYTALEQEPG